MVCSAHFLHSTALRDQIASDYFCTAIILSKKPLPEHFEMASCEKRMIPLEIEDHQDDRIEEQHSHHGLVQVKFPSRPRRKVVIIIAVVLVVVIVAAALIGTFVSQGGDSDSNDGKNKSKY